MSDPHVLQIIDGLNIGGAEILLRELTVGLMKRGFRISVAYGTPGPLVSDMKALGVHLIRIPRLLRVDPLQLTMLYRAIKMTAPAIVHTHLFKSDFHGRLAARLAGVPVVVSTLHSIDRWAERWPLGNLYGLTARYADRIIAVSEDVKNFHAQHTGVDESKFVTIDNGVDTDRYVGLGSARDTVRNELSIPQGSILFGIIGRLTPPKDHRTFLHAVKLIFEKVPHARFLVVGDGPLRESLVQLTGELGIQNAVIFTGFRKDIPAVLAALDVLVISSVWEGLPVNLLEGMASFKPVVATAVGGIPAVVTTETAILAPPSDPKAIAQACILLAEDSALRQRMGNAGHKRVIQHYSLDAMVDQTARLYAELLKAKGLQHFIPSVMAGYDT